MFFNHKSTTVSPWHNIPLHAGDGLYNFVAEIPKQTSAKFEVATVREDPGGSWCAVYIVACLP